jgi:hypothetical protein
MEDRMKTATDVAKELYPHTSDSIIDISSTTADVHAGNWACIILDQKSIGEVKKILRYLIETGNAAEAKQQERNAQAASPRGVKTSAPKKKRGA